MLTAEIGWWQVFQLSIFVLSHEKYHYPGQRPDFRFFFSYFVLLPLLGNFEWHCLLEIRIFLSFFFFGSHNSRKFRHATLDWPDTADCDIKHMWKITIILCACLTRISRLFSGQEIVLNHRSLYNSVFFLSFLITKYVKHRINRNSTF